mmetsp:Transcript_16203/g.36452  ORF Transcript_16203/g.36452 Transcript_16203/m.36452 type:complete len:582 (-) Transcript_16203:605-2350(-)
MGWKTRISEAQKLHRPKHLDWKVDKLAYPPNGVGDKSRFDIYVDSVLHGKEDEKWEHNSQIGRGRSLEGNDIDTRAIPYIIDAKSTDVQDFIKLHERNGQNGIPTVIKNIPSIDEWRCKPQQESGDHELFPSSTWSASSLKNNPSLRNVRFKCGEDDYGKSVRIKLRDFIKYMKHCKDDSPLYIFDSTFEDDEESGSALLKDYDVPSFFPEDLFGIIGERRRPPHRWFLVGPKRSGSTVHIDPLGTSAWNTLINGVKRWVLFPPDTLKKIVQGKHLIPKNEDDEAIHYFMTILPRIKEDAAKRGIHLRCYEFNQFPGETVFIPTGWWHSVLNLTDTVGITQNYCSSQNFDEVWTRVRKSRKKMAWKFLCRLDSDCSGRYCSLAARARALNARDSFVMKCDDGRFCKNMPKSIESDVSGKRGETSTTGEFLSSPEKFEQNLAGSASFRSLDVHFSCSVDNMRLSDSNGGSERVKEKSPCHRITDDSSQCSIPRGRSHSSTGYNERKKRKDRSTQANTYAKEVKGGDNSVRRSHGDVRPRSNDTSIEGKKERRKGKKKNHNKNYRHYTTSCSGNSHAEKKRKQ